MAKWTYTLRLGDVFHNEALSFEQRRDAIASRIRSARWFKEDADYATTIVEHLEDAIDADEFDEWWDEFYDYANEERIWVQTR